MKICYQSILKIIEPCFHFFSNRWYVETDDENLLLINTHFKPISGFLKKYTKQLVNLSGSDAYFKVFYIHISHQTQKSRRNL